ncbi:MAG: FAD-dependent oxidoreductase, partial [Candidatus Brocadiae bacterium]|nr:FAD-dependent oxidoreductase [Candidatus Brocadiia bacterium]
YRKRTRRKADITHSETIGVVGSGPAGLTVAHDCIKQGYAVTVYEALPKPGGLLSCGIPKYRLPDDILQQDLDDIVALGVDVRAGVAVGKDIGLQDLRQKHGAVVLAVGLSEGRDLPLEGRDHPDVLVGTPFLRDVALGRPVEVREHVVVIGGGNVAVDVARTAMRLGARTVKMVCLENEEEIPAWDWECREALEEGIEFVYRRGPTKVVVEDGRITGIVVREVERVFDEEGNFAPTYFDERLSTVPGRMVIITIGQASNLDLVQGSGVELTQRGLLVFDPATMATSQKGVYSCGEVVTGPGSAIEAVASGHRAAQAVLGYLETGQVRPVAEQEVEEVEELPEDVI